MRGNELRHLEHVNLVLAPKDDAELVVCDDLPLVRWVLEILPLDVLPELLHNLTARKRC